MVNDRRGGMFFAFMCTALAGCGETQVSPANRRVVESLATAVSARNSEWLRENVEQISARKAAGQLAESEAQALQVIVDLAGAGDWQAAEARAFALRDGQRGTAEDEVQATSEKPKLRAPGRDPLRKPKGARP